MIDYSKSDIRALNKLLGDMWMKKITSELDEDLEAAYNS